MQGQPQIRGMTCSTDAYGVHADFRLHNKPVNAMLGVLQGEVHLLSLSADKNMCPLPDMLYCEEWLIDWFAWWY